jgi:hypothetical protein
VLDAEGEREENGGDDKSAEEGRERGRVVGIVWGKGEE